MREKDFYKLVDKRFAECMGIMKSKGTAYSGLEDKLGNFKRVAKNLAMTPEQVWYVYFAKHLDALSAFLRGEYKDSEPIQGRIMDLINYLFLLDAILIEQGDEGEAVPNTEDSGDMFFPDEIVDPTERMLASE
jgi:hypothetical protein